MSLIKTGPIVYAGKEVDAILKESFNETYFKDTFGAKLLTGYKSKFTYFDLSTSAQLEAYEVCPSTFGNSTLNQRTGEMCEFQWLTEMDKNALVGTLREKELEMGFNNESPTQDTLFLTTLTDLAIETIASQWDNIILNGDIDLVAPDPAYLGLCDGLLKKWSEDLTVETVDSGTLNSGTILAELNKIYTAAPSEIKSRTKPAGKLAKLALSRDMMDLYEEALTQTNSGYNFFSPDQAGVNFYRGFEVVVLDHLPTANAFMTFPDNIALYTDGDGDFAEMRTWDLSDSKPCDIIQMRVKFRSAVDYGYGKYIVWYRPA